MHDCGRGDAVAFSVAVLFLFFCPRAIFSEHLHTENAALGIPPPPPSKKKKKTTFFVFL